MAMNLRLEAKHEAILESLMPRLELATKSKTIMWLIEHFSEMDEDRLRFLREAQEWKERYQELRRGVIEEERAKKILAEKAEHVSRLLNGT